MNSCITVGITGGIGSGKSTICRMLTAMGYPVFYSDKAASELLDTDVELRKQITELFGAQSYHETGLNKPYVASIVFKNDELLNQLNHIVHPRVRKAFESWKSAFSGIVFNEAAILFETGSFTSFDKTILVCCPAELRIKRIQVRDGLNAEEIRTRMNKQWSDEEKRKLSDFVIENDEVQMVIPQVLNILKKLQPK